jgi:hypothetical protein
MRNEWMVRGVGMGDAKREEEMGALVIRKSKVTKRVQNLVVHMIVKFF